MRDGWVGRQRTFRHRFPLWTLSIVTLTFTVSETTVRGDIDASLRLTQNQFGNDSVPLGICFLYEL